MMKLAELTNGLTDELTAVWVISDFFGERRGPALARLMQDKSGVICFVWNEKEKSEIFLFHFTQNR